MTGDVEAGSRERMLEAAIALMRGSGLTGAGINEVVRASGAPKGSVYHFFPAGKQQLVAEAIGVYAERVEGFIDQALSSRTAAPDKVKALFAAFAQRIEQAGFSKSCAVGAVALDLDEDLEGLRSLLAGAFQTWIAVIARHFDLGDARRTRAFAGLLLTAIEGAYVRARAEATSRAFQDAGTLLATLV